MHSVRASTIGAGLIGIGFVAAACGGGGGVYGGGSAGPSPSGAASAPASSQPAVGGAASVTTRQVALGTIVTDSAGRTVYLFEKDTGMTPTCTGPCATAWPPLTTSGGPQAGAGLNAALLGTTHNPDGRTQLTYGGHPLYYFQGDKAAGQTAGQGLDAFGAKWYVVNAQGSKIDKD